MPARNDAQERARALGDELVRIHDRLRADLAAILTGAEQPGPDLRAQLYERCLSACAAVHAHHGNESERGFPLLEDRFPELAPVLAELRREHEVLAETRRRFLGTLGRLRPGGADATGREDQGGADQGGAADAGEVYAGLRRLAADLDAHFRREEGHLVAALNSL
ncbi:MAG TPA: hemerythrin domain-containing protein [Streptosporangiaceae bacterium]